MKEARQFGHVGGDIRLETREWNMKFKLVIPTTVILLLVSFPARANNARPFFLRTAVIMNGAEVPAGLYELSWESQNSKVSVTLWKDGRFFATARGTWVKTRKSFVFWQHLQRPAVPCSEAVLEFGPRSIA